MPRLVRKRPLTERVMSTLNPMDFLLWLSEELETRDWDSKVAGTQIGLGLNFLFMLARANYGTRDSKDDLFNDDAGSGWISLIIYPIVWGLACLSVTNATYAMTRTRKYRLFAADVDVKPSTTSAHRVKVTSSPAASSPLRFIADMIAPESAESRAHPDRARDVWELSVWDPLPICLRLSCFFGPGHALVYMISLPLASLDPSPSMTVFNTVLTQVTLSALLLLLTSLFAQQAKDNAIIQREVFHEYDTKFVRPRLHPVVRDVGTQVSEYQPKGAQAFVQVGTPTTLIRNSFATRPSQNYGVHTPTQEVDSPGLVNTMNPKMFTPTYASRGSEAFSTNTSEQQPSTSARKSLPANYSPTASSSAEFGNYAGFQPNSRPAAEAQALSQSPLRKSVSNMDVNETTQSPRNSREMAAYEQRGLNRSPSPTKQKDLRRSMGHASSGTSFSAMASSRASQDRPRPRW